MVHSEIVLCAKLHNNPCQISLHLDFSLWSHIRENFRMMLNSLSCCCAATIIACFSWVLMAPPAEQQQEHPCPEVLCCRRNSLVHNTQLAWAHWLTSTLCSLFFELGLTSKTFLQELLKSFKALFLSPSLLFFLSLVIIGERCIWFAFIPGNKCVFFPGAQMQLLLQESCCLSRSAGCLGTSGATV